MTTPIPWKTRCAMLDGSKGISNKMIQSCMLAEISDLRKALKKRTPQDKTLVATATRLRRERDEWKSAALRYQKQLIGAK